MASSCPPPEIAADANIDLYKAAYNYIVKVGTKKEKDYVISYMTYDLDRHGFQDKLVDMPEEKKLVEEFNKRHYFYLEEDKGVKNSLASLTTNSKKPKFVIFFSAIEDGMIVANVIPIEKRRKLSIETINNLELMCLWNMWKEYLFIFNNDRTIKKVAYQEKMM